jgi:predicted RecB family endonuclease
LKLKDLISQLEKEIAAAKAEGKNVAMPTRNLASMEDLREKLKVEYKAASTKLMELMDDRAEAIEIEAVQKLRYMRLTQDESQRRSGSG